MKTFGSIALAVMLAGSVGEVHAQARKSAGDYINEASSRIGRMVDTSMRAGYRANLNSFLLGGALLKQSKTDWIGLGTVELDPTCTYNFLAAGDGDAIDVDIQVLDSSGNVVVQDATANVEATAEYRPSARGRYTIRMRLYASQRDLPCYCMAAVLCK